MIPFIYFARVSLDLRNSINQYYYTHALTAV